MSGHGSGKKWTFLRPKRSIRDVLGAATREAGSAGIDSLDLLVTTLDTSKAARVVKDLGPTPITIQTAARAGRPSRDQGPGLTDDAKRVIDALGQRAIQRRADPDVVDLLVALATADCLARQILHDHGIDAASFDG